MNEYDSNRILDLTQKIDYTQTKNLNEASCYILNTCHIREKATDKVYHDIGRVKKAFRKRKKPIVLIAGCVAQAEGDIILKIDKRYFRPTEVETLLGDASLAKKELGWTPEISIDDLIKEMTIIHN